MKIPWKMILIGAAGLFILLLVGSLTGANQKLLGLIRNQLKSDQARVVEVKEQNEKWYEETIRSLQDQLDANKKKQAGLQSEIDQLETMIHAKDSEIRALRKERESIVTSSEPDLIVDDLHRLGYRSERRRPR